MISIFKCLQRKTQSLYGKMNAILLPRNYFKFPLVTLTVIQLLIKAFKTQKLYVFCGWSMEMPSVKIFSETSEYNMYRKLVQTDQGYESHQLLSDLDTYIRRYCSFLKMACNPPPKNKNSHMDSCKACSLNMEQHYPV